MKPLRVLFVLAALAGTASIVPAATPLGVSPLPASAPLVLQPSAVTLGPSNSCPPTYSNTLNAVSLYYPAGAGVELADDLHMVSPGHLCGIDFGYYKATPGTTGAAIAFYANDPTDSIQPFVLLAGPYVVSNLPSGTNYIHLNLEPGTGMPDLTQDIWVGISFSTDETGLLVSNPPELGGSHDLCYLTPPGEPLTFCDPEQWANFCLAVYASDFTVAAGGTTWGQLKQLYR